MKSAAERYERPDWVRRINAMAEAMGGTPRDLIPIDAEDLWRRAVDIAGGLPQSDFGDPGLEQRFLALARAIDASSMHVLGRIMTKQELQRSLVTRLLLARAVDAVPAIESERVEAPLIVTGPARSGTSILFELLSLDPDLRAPLAWEALHPIPFPSAAFSAESPDPRLRWGESEQEFWADVQPEFAAIHELRSDLPVECVTLTMACFCGPHWPMISQLAEYDNDVDGMYDFHRRILQVLQHANPPKTWLLKTPGHLMTLPNLFATYPDAWIVQTHRDPAKTMPSTVSTTAMVQWLRNDVIDLPLLAAAIEGVFGFALNNSALLRENGSVPDRFVDVHFVDLLKDPVETLRRAYGAMERPFGSEHSERIQRYLAEKPRGKFGTHHYTPEEWGFTAQGLRETLAPYIEYFGVALES